MDEDARGGDEFLKGLAQDGVAIGSVIHDAAGDKLVDLGVHDGVGSIAAILEVVKGVGRFAEGGGDAVSRVRGDDIEAEEEPNAGILVDVVFAGVIKDVSDLVGGDFSPIPIAFDGFGGILSEAGIAIGLE